MLNLLSLSLSQAPPQIVSKTTIEEIIIGVAIGLILMMITGVVAYIKGKRLSIDAISRKTNIYIPLIDELSRIRHSTIESSIKLEFSMEIVGNNYKYALNKRLIKKLSNLLNHINEFNKIRIESIAHRIIVESFIEEYEKVFGTIVEGISYHSTPDGDEYEIEEEVPELSILRHYLSNESLQNLIKNADMNDYIINFNEDDYAYVNEDLVNIFNIAFNSSWEGRKSNKLTIDGWDRSIAEYMALNVGFENKFKNDMHIHRKNELLENNFALSEDIASDIKKRVNKIVKKYEREVV